MNIILVGEYHFDPNRGTRLSKLLDYYKPDAIGVEDDPTGLNEMEMLHKIASLDKTPSLIEKMKQDNPEWNIETQLTFFSPKAIPDYHILEYVRSTKSELYFCEQQKELNNHIQQFNSTNPTNNYDVLKKTISQLEDESRKEYLDESPVPKQLATSYSARDERVAQNIIETSIKHDSYLYIGGLDHIFGNYFNLYDRLNKEGKDVVRLKLDQADNLK